PCARDDAGPAGRGARHPAAARLRWLRGRVLFEREEPPHAGPGRPDGVLAQREVREVSLAKLVVGNWKMSGSWAALWELADLAQRDPPACEAAVCVPLPLLPAAQTTLQATPLRWGAQDCSAHAEGPHT